MTTASAETSTSPPVDVAILVALEEEFGELAADLGAVWDARPNPSEGGYDYFWTDSPSGYRCIATFVGKMGPQEAVAAGKRLLAFGPAVLVNIGIAAGLHDDVCIGDVVVPDLVQAYDKTGKAAPDGEGWTWHPRPDAFRPEHALVEEAKHLRMARRFSYLGWQAAGGIERAFLEKRNPKPIAELRARRALGEQPHIRVVPLASGCFVVAARSFAEWIRSQNAGLKATEMEAAGMLLAAAKQRTHVQTLVIRGISDHIGVPKSQTDAIEAGALRGMAMRNAWRLFKLYMTEGLLPRTSSSMGTAKVEAPVSSIEAQAIAALEQERDRLLRAGESTAAIETQLHAARKHSRDGRTPSATEVLSGRYELLEVVGTGGFATVWRAHDRSKGRLVAIKLLHGQWLHDRSRIDRFISGAKRLQNLRHPAIVAVHDDPVHEGDRCYCVMEWMPGKDLRRAVLSQQLDRQQALEAVAQALEGLAHAHAQGVIHRDVKPGNILLDVQKNGRLSDFDLAHALDSTHGTRIGGMGTFAYSAPEQLSDASRVDARADIYGAGMTVLFALLGTDPPPFVAALQASRLDELPCGSRLRGAVRTAVAYEADARTVSCAQLIEAIRNNASDTSDAPELATPAPTTIGYLIWEEFMVGAKPHQQTFLLRPRGRGDLRAIPAAMPGVFVTSTTTAWELRESSRRIINQPVPSLEDPPSPDATELAPVVVPVQDLIFHDLTSRTISLAGEWPPTGERQDGLEDLNRRFAEIRSIGPLVFVRYDDMYFYQDAPSVQYGSTFSVIDLEGPRPFALEQFLADDELAHVRAVESGRADTMFASDDDFDGNLDGESDLTLLLPAYTEAGVLKLLYQFTREASRGGSDGLWEVYSRSQRVPSDIIPARLDPYRYLPPLVSAWRASKMYQTENWGWSPVFECHREWCEGLFGKGALDPAG